MHEGISNQIYLAQSFSSYSRVLLPLPTFLLSSQYSVPLRTAFPFFFLSFVLVPPLSFPYLLLLQVLFLFHFTLWSSVSFLFSVSTLLHLLFLLYSFFYAPPPPFPSPFPPSPPYSSLCPPSSPSPSTYSSRPPLQPHFRERWLRHIPILRACSKQMFVAARINKGK